MSEGLFLVDTSLLPWIRRIITNGSKHPNGNKEERRRCCRHGVTTDERDKKRKYGELKPRKRERERENYKREEDARL